MRWNIGIDLGTENLRMAEPGSGAHLEAPALLALKEGWDGPVAVGPAAQVLLGRSGTDTRLVAPLRDSVLENNLYAEQLLTWALQQRAEEKRMRRPSLLLTQAPHARPVQQDALLRAALDAGAAEAMTLRSDVAAALGAGMDPLAPEGRMVVDVGAGSMTASVFTLGRLAASETLPYGLNRIDELLIRSLRAEEGFSVGRRTAAELKHTLGSAQGGASEGAPMQVAGIDMVSRLPRLRPIAPERVQQACEGLVRELVQLCVAVLAAIPEELAADLNETGLVLCGGGATLSGLDKRLGDALGIACRTEEAPAACAVKGLVAYMGAPHRWETALRWALSPVARR